MEKLPILYIMGFFVAMESMLRVSDQSIVLQITSDRSKQYVCQLEKDRLKIDDCRSRFP